MRWHRLSATPLFLFLFLLLGALAVGVGCSAPPSENTPTADMTTVDPPCSCTTGERRCTGNSAQVCEVTGPGCSSWG